MSDIMSVSAQGPWHRQWLDDAESVSQWQNGHLSAIMSPTAGALAQAAALQEQHAGPKQAQLLITPRLRPSTDPDSPRPQAAAAEDSAAHPQDVYRLIRVDVLGSRICLLKCFPSKWQVTPAHVVPHQHLRA